MELYQRIAVARKQKGLTQEELADLSNVTVRTIQRIESGESTPRAYTLKAIATALDSSFEELLAGSGGNNDTINNSIPSPAINEDDKHFLKILCLSCFSYLVIPFIHFLVPAYLLKKSTERNPGIIAFAKRMIRSQLYWKVALWLLLLATLAYNLVMAACFQKPYFVHYLIPFFIMYFANAMLIAYNLVRIQKIDLSFSISV